MRDEKDALEGLAPGEMGSVLGNYVHSDRVAVTASVAEKAALHAIRTIRTMLHTHPYYEDSNPMQYLLRKQKIDVLGLGVIGDEQMQKLVISELTEKPVSESYPDAKDVKRIEAKFATLQTKPETTIGQLKRPFDATFRIVQEVMDRLPIRENDKPAFFTKLYKSLNDFKDKMRDGFDSIKMKVMALVRGRALCDNPSLEVKDLNKIKAAPGETRGQVAPVLTARERAARERAAGGRAGRL